MPSAAARSDPTNHRTAARAGWILIALTPLVVLGLLEISARLLGGRILRSIAETGGPPRWLDPDVQIKERRWAELLSSSPRDLDNYYRTYRWDRFLMYALRPGLDLPLTDVTAPPPIRDRTRWIFHTNDRGFN